MDENRLIILRTNDDKTGYQIAKMSNFIENYCNYSIGNLSRDSSMPSVLSINIDNIGIINDAISGAIKYLKNGTTLIPDFENLPKDIKEKLEKGLYTIGESKQVNGNLRPVILDECGVRVKDITLKKIKKDIDTSSEIGNIQSQIQLKRINENLEKIQELQYYQIARARDSAVLVPFYDARDLILRAQTSETFIKQQEYLEEASLKLDHAFNEVAKDLDTNKNFLIMQSSKILTKQNQIDEFVIYMSEDVQLLTNICGIQMHISDYLGLTNLHKIAFKKYKDFMIMFANDRNNKTKMSGFELMHDNCKYNLENTDSWYKFSNLLISNLKSSEVIESEEVLLVGVEDIANEG